MKKAEDLLPFEKLCLLEERAMEASGELFGTPAFQRLETE